MRIPVLTARRPSPGRRTARTAREPDQGSGQGVALVCRRPGRIPVPDVALAAEKDGHLDDLTSNHSPKFLPPMQPCLRTGTEALLAAALAWLAP
jgi:hypothetical protein